MPPLLGEYGDQLVDAIELSSAAVLVGPLPQLVKPAHDRYYALPYVRSISSELAECILCATLINTQRGSSGITSLHLHKGYVTGQKEVLKENVA